MRLNTNTSTLRAVHEIHNQSTNVSSSQRKLSTGQRIIHAGDDAAGLSIGSKQEARLRSTQAAMKNANQAISFFQVADSALRELSGIMIRLRELGIQAASDTVGDNERTYINQEAQSMKHEVNRISGSLEYMGKKLFEGGEELQFMIGVDNDSSHYMITDMKNLAQNTHALGIFDVNFTNKAQARFSLKKLDFAIEKINESGARIGAYQNRLVHASNNLENSNINLAQAKSRILDADYAYETSQNIKSKIKLDAAGAVLNTAKDFPKSVLRLLERS